MTSELQMEKWSVLSYRGLEATGLTHDEARRLVHRLASEGSHGLCILSDDAARRLSSPSHPSSAAVEPELANKQ
jgi:hypothetical protein